MVRLCPFSPIRWTSRVSCHDRCRACAGTAAGGRRAGQRGTAETFVSSGVDQRWSLSRTMCWAAGAVWAWRGENVDAYGGTKSDRVRAGGVAACFI